MRVSLYVIVTSSSQLSVAVSVGATGTASHSTLVSSGQLSNTGACVSTTVIVCSQVEKFPQLSVAVHVRTSV